MTVLSTSRAVLPALLFATGIGWTSVAGAAPSPVGVADAPPILQQVVVSGLHSNVPCAGDSLRVVLLGQFPSECYGVRHVELLPVRCAFPCIPPIRVLVDDGGCLEMICRDTVVTWSRELHLPPLPAGAYTQSASVFVASCTDSFPSEPPRAVLMQPFVVRPESLCADPTPGGCLLVSWPGTEPGTLCNARLDPQGHAKVGMALYADRSLRALQGRFHLGSEVFRIVAIRPIGPASGATLLWDPTPDGATFVLFSANGTAIPASRPGDPPPTVLAVEVALEPDAHAPRVTHLYASNLVGADTEGHELLECPIYTLRLVAAAICGDAPPCDANGDGRSTVGDLVAQILCLQAGCADSSRFDCDGNGHFDLDDVLCCARRMLAGGFTPGAPAPPAGGARLEFGEAARTATGWRVPLRLEGVTSLGGARLALRFPAAAYRVAGVTRDAGSPGWVLVSDSGSGSLSIGLLNLSPARPDVVGAGTVSVAIDLEPVEGSAAGGELAVEAAEFASPSGGEVEIPLPAALPLPAGLSIAAARPNPFAGSTSIVLALDRGADLTVAVLDVSGRQVATLFRGPLAPGTRTLTWNGADDSGRALAGGMYFVRATGGGATATRKLVLLRGR